MSKPTPAVKYPESNSPNRLILANLPCFKSSKTEKEPPIKKLSEDSHKEYTVADEGPAPISKLEFSVPFAFNKTKRFTSVVL